MQKLQKNKKRIQKLKIIRNNTVVKTKKKNILIKHYKH